VEILQAFTELISPLNILLLFLGVLAGVTVGAIPGLTATLAISLLLPFTFMLSPTPALLLLLGIYCGGVYGGAITAILVRAPGTPGAVATSFDGYPLTLKGQGGRALGIAAFGSFCGGIISVIIMVIMSPAISSFALRFSSAEYFALAVFGLTIIFSISGKSILKGMIACVLGLLFATFGIDLISPHPRFNFEQHQLTIGLPLLPVIIGLFAVSEVFRMLEDTKKRKKISASFDKVIPSLKDIKALKWIFVKSGVIGSFIGALPGAGANMASFVSYSEAKRTSKKPEEFGKGNIEGVASAESANSAVVGGALIPTLTLGIPGDAVTAVLLGALTIQGIQPGPLLFVEHKDLIYVLYIGLFVAMFFLLFIGLSAARVFAKISKVGKNLLIPFVIIFSLVGAYAAEWSMYHLWVALIFGVVGYLLEKYGFPVAPLALAFILGPIIERSFRRAIIRSDEGLMIFISSPISITLLSLTVLIVSYSFYKQNKAKKQLM
jgi:putative tricarboxylic transport membrane protein